MKKMQAKRKNQVQGAERQIDVPTLALLKPVYDQLESAVALIENLMLPVDWKVPSILISIEATLAGQLDPKPAELFGEIFADTAALFDSLPFGINGGRDPKNDEECNVLYALSKAFAGMREFALAHNMFAFATENARQEIDIASRVESGPAATCQARLDLARVATAAKSFVQAENLYRLVMNAVDAQTRPDRKPGTVTTPALGVAYQVVALANMALSELYTSRMWKGKGAGVSSSVGLEHAYLYLHQAKKLAGDADTRLASALTQLNAQSCIRDAERAMQTCSHCLYKPSAKWRRTTRGAAATALPSRRGCQACGSAKEGRHLCLSCAKKRHCCIDCNRLV
jgi:hypothetical protein